MTPRKDDLLFTLAAGLTREAAAQVEAQKYAAVGGKKVHDDLGRAATRILAQDVRLLRARGALEELRMVLAVEMADALVPMSAIWRVGEALDKVRRTLASGWTADQDGGVRKIGAGR